MEQNRAKRRWLFVGGMALLAMLLVTRLFIVDFYKIPQNGMYPGLPQGSRFLGLKRAFHHPSEVRRGDIIMFTRTLAGRSYAFVWRVIGLPGDRVEVAGHAVTINGQALVHQEVRRDGKVIVYRETNGDTTYEVAYRTPPGHTAAPTVMTVPADEFFVLGDNRDDARDSRFDGTVSFASIIGRKFR